MKGHACQLQEPPTECIAQCQKHERNQYACSPFLILNGKKNQGWGQMQEWAKAVASVLTLLFSYSLCVV